MLKLRNFILEFRNALAGLGFCPPRLLLREPLTMLAEVLRQLGHLLLMTRPVSPPSVRDTDEGCKG